MLPKWEKFATLEYAEAPPSEELVYLSGLAWGSGWHLLRDLVKQEIRSVFMAVEQPIVLSVIAGATDSIGFLGLNGLFTAHITGNLVVLAALQPVDDEVGSIAGRVGSM